MRKHQFLKKTIVAMMIVALLFCSVELTDLGIGLTLTAKAATAESGQCGRDLTWTLKDGILTIEGTGDMYDYYDYSESKLSPFHVATDITSIVISEGVTSIGLAAFIQCSNLKSIELPEGVTSIGWGAFGACDSLTSIVIPESVTSIEDAFTWSPDLVIYGCSGSYAEQYAKENNISFKNICEHGISAYETTTTKATTSKNGSIVMKCSVCGNVASKTTIYRPKTVTLSATSYTYNGKTKKPSITVTDSNGKTISASNYTATYSNNKNVGKATVTIKFKENYSGTLTKTFKINPVATSISKLTAKSKGFTAKWTKKTAQVTGYQLQYATSRNLSKAKTVTISKNSTTSKTISKLTKNKKYYVRIRTYKTVNGTKYYSSWSNIKNIKTK